MLKLQRAQELDERRAIALVNPPPTNVLEKFAHALDGGPLAVDQTADGRRLLVYRDNGQISQWGIETGELIHDCFLFHSGSRWLTVTPDGKARGSLEYFR